MNQENNSTRKPRHNRAYRLGLEERLTETHHKLTKTTHQLLRSPDNPTAQELVQRAITRSNRLQALLDATEPTL